VTEDGSPTVIPTLQARVGDVVYFHGSAASRTLRALGRPLACCLTATLIDGIVLARSIFNHSVNYRSVVVYGEAEPIDDAEKAAALEAFSDRLLPGRWAEARPPTPSELKATTILRLPLDVASAKVRTGPPKDEEADYALPVWAGVIPLELVAGEPEPDPRLGSSAAPPRWEPRRRNPNG
jgi:nitroimidazol reductase NimA-like FMN-containing flavoprotein (pyridoxamine 5'-phosphate oxidase superfamily)